jgi:diphthine-ammonia ligase
VRVAVFWSGGKDSFSVYEKALEGGHRVVCLVTFKGDKPFLCHPIECMGLQADALGVPHVVVGVGEPHLQGYRKALGGLAKDLRVEGIVTGDMAVVDRFHGNWTDEACKGTELAIIRPLWGMNRHDHLKELQASGARIVMTCVMKKYFGRSWLGRAIDGEAIAELEALSEKHGIDPCGEGGEYHTMVLDSPRFSRKIEMEWCDDGETETLRFAKAEGFFLKSKGQK